jgi:BirA family biotin operon repressor/biotin-[acetyl-CoA-carboxylase] ligase
MEPMETRQHILLRLRAGEWVSGEAISVSLGISRAAISKHIGALRAAGCSIESAPRKGYRLISEPDQLTQEAVAPYLTAQVVGREWHYEAQVGSTNACARDAAFAGGAEGAVFVADEQLAGRGRRGREWASPPGYGIYLSVLLRPELPPDALPLLTLMAAVAVARAIRDVGGGEARIKWPNDILISGHKVCGILTEMVADAESLSCVILGIGLNVNTPADLLPERPLFPASSLAALAGRRLPRAELLGVLLNQLDQGYCSLQMEGAGPMLAAWEELSDLMGRRVCVTRVTDEVVGIAEGLDASGALRIRDDAGAPHLILSGDIRYAG